MAGNGPLGITDVILRDAHQSLIATRMRTEDMLPICDQLDAIGYWSLECWGGATFDACLRYLAEDPWDRLTGPARRCRNHAPKCSSEGRTFWATGTTPMTWCGLSSNKPRAMAWMSSASLMP